MPAPEREAKHEDTRKSARALPANEDTRPARPTTARAMQSVMDDLAKETSHEGPVTADDHRRGAILQILEVPRLLVGDIEAGVRLGLDAIAAPDIRPTSEVLTLLATTAALVVAGVSGSAAAVVTAKFAAGATQAAAKFVENVVKDAMKMAFTPGQPKAVAVPVTGIKSAFATYLAKELSAARARLAARISELSDRVARVPQRDLDVLAARLIDEHAARGAEIHAVAANHTVIAWTNFLARAKHGAMALWDPWTDHGSIGAVPLRGAQRPADGADDGRTIVGQNVAPETSGELLEHTQRHSLPEHYGILEVHIYRNGGLVQLPGLGMRLDNVGPDARAVVRKLGRVRDVPINKIVRVYGASTNGPLTTVASMLITADGHVRRHELGGEQPVYIRNREPVGPARLRENQHCLGELAAGRETPDCHSDHKLVGDKVAELAERAQDMPLSLLEA